MSDINRSSVQEPKRYGMKHIVLGIIVVLIFGPIIYLLALFAFFGQDDPKPNDSDLQLGKVEIPIEQNAFYPLKQASEKLNIKKGEEGKLDEIATGASWNEEWAAQTLQDNKEALEYFNQAVALPIYQDPYYADPEKIGPATTFGLPLSQVRSLARIESVNVYYLYNREKSKEAIEESFKILELGHKLENTPRGSFIAYLMGMAIKSMALKDIRTILSSIDNTPEDLKNFKSRLDKYKENNEGLKNSIKLEYAYISNMTDALKKGELDQILEEEGYSNPVMPRAKNISYYFKPNQTKSLFAENTRNTLESIDNCTKIKTEDYKRLTPTSIFQMAFTENLVGKILADVIKIGDGGMASKKCLDEFTLSGTQTLLALKAYQKENGSLPESLNNLVPQYIIEIPTDPFSGDILKYSKDKKIIYSVGQDQKDEGGGKETNYMDSKEPTLEIKF